MSWFLQDKRQWDWDQIDIKLEAKYVIYQKLATWWSSGLVFKALDSQSRGPVFKTIGWLQGRLSPFYPFEVDNMSTRNYWELNGKM